VSQTVRQSIIPKTLRGWVKLFLLAVVLVVGFALLLLYSTPRWYAPLDAKDPRVIDTAERAQNNILDLHNKLEQLPLGERQWSITQEEINSFLSVHSAEIAPRNGHSGQISDPIVILKPGQITVAARVAGVPGTGDGGGVVTLVVGVAAIPGSGTEPTAIQITLQSATMGSLPVPPSLVQEKVPQLSTVVSGALAKTVDAATVDQLLRGRAVPVPFVYRKRLVHIKDLQVTDGKLTLAMTL
jgi:hypothetical protein